MQPAPAAVINECATCAEIHRRPFIGVRQPADLLAGRIQNRDGFIRQQQHIRAKHPHIADQVRVDGIGEALALPLVALRILSASKHNRQNHRHGHNSRHRRARGDELLSAPALQPPGRRIRRLLFFHTGAPHFKKPHFPTGKQPLPPDKIRGSDITPAPAPSPRPVSGRAQPRQSRSPHPPACPLRRPEACPP